MSKAIEDLVEAEIIFVREALDRFFETYGKNELPQTPEDTERFIAALEVLDQNRRAFFERAEIARHRANHIVELRRQLLLDGPDIP